MAVVATAELPKVLRVQMRGTYHPHVPTTGSGSTLTSVSEIRLVRARCSSFLQDWRTCAPIGAPESLRVGQVLIEHPARTGWRLAAGPMELVTPLPIKQGPHLAI